MKSIATRMRFFTVTIGPRCAMRTIAKSVAGTVPVPSAHVKSEFFGCELRHGDHVYYFAIVLRVR